MPAAKRDEFKGQPDTTYVVNHPEGGEIKFSTNSKGEYTPKNDREEFAISLAYPEPPPVTTLPEELVKLAEEEKGGGD